MLLFNTHFLYNVGLYLFFLLSSYIHIFFFSCNYTLTPLNPYVYLCTGTCIYVFTLYFFFPTFQTCTYLAPVTTDEVCVKIRNSIDYSQKITRQQFMDGSGRSSWKHAFTMMVSSPQRDLLIKCIKNKIGYFHSFEARIADAISSSK